MDSPCIGECLLGASGLCGGCGRTLDEIACWGSLNAESKRAIIDAVALRRGRQEPPDAASSTSPFRRFGFTLVELLVAISIIGILLALFLPAVQSVRESARRVQCVNHLKQMGIGFHNYHGVYRCFPVGGAGAVSATHPRIRRLWRPSWGSVLLPFIEQQSLYEQLDLDAPYVDAVNHDGGATLVETYLCPSAPKSQSLRPNGDAPWSSLRFARTDYGGNYGERGLRCPPHRNCQNSYSDIGISGSTGRGVLLFGQDPQIGLRDILDGASQTIVLGEAPEGLHSIWIGHKNLFDQSAPINAQTQPTSSWPSCATALKSREGNFCDFGQEFHCYHPGGAHFLMADGAARFVSEHLDLTVFAALLSRRGGELVLEF